jgi:hypothetical protein
LNIIELLNKKASQIKEEEIKEDTVNELLDHFSSKIRSLSKRAYGVNDGVAYLAFREYAQETLEKGLSSFLFKKQHWRSGRSIGPYLISCLNRLSDNLKQDVDAAKKVKVPVCPGCKSLNERSTLHYDGNNLVCRICDVESERLEKNRELYQEYEYRIRKIFSRHSKGGCRCPSCNRFIPNSFIGDSVNVSCPYDNCYWFGLATDLEKMAHPVAVDKLNRNTVSINVPFKNQSLEGSNALSLEGVLESTDANPDLKIEYEQKYTKEIQVAKETISQQKIRLSLQPRYKVIKKLLMYEAFESLLNSDPFDMIAYLIHGKTVSDRPIQSIIFQKYIFLIENALPLDVNEDGIPIEVYSLLAPEIELFLGVSKFTGLVNDYGNVQNNTYEIYTGSKCKGPCFIGYLCDVQDMDGNSLMSKVEYYTFSSVKMSGDVPSETKVQVIHFRIPPHYEMFSMVLLQRTRRKIVDSIYKRLNDGKQRPLRRAGWQE